MTRLSLCLLASLALTASCNSESPPPLAIGCDDCDASPSPVDESENFRPCIESPGPCTGPFECVPSNPRHPDHADGNFCFLPCSGSAYCRESLSSAVCVCKGVDGNTDGPTPDGYCDCGATGPE